MLCKMFVLFHMIFNDIDMAIFFRYKVMEGLEEASRELKESKRRGDTRLLETSSSTATEQMNPEEQRWSDLKSQVIHLLVRCKTPISENEFCRQFRTMFEQSLEPRQFGYTDLQDLLVKLKFEKVLELNYDQGTSRLTVELSRKPKNPSFQFTERLLENQVFTEMEVPTDAVKHCSLKVQKLPDDIEEGFRFSLVVTQVCPEDPKMFWFNLYDGRSYFTAVQKLMDKMEKYYGSKHGVAYNIKIKDLEPGDVIAARYRKEGFHRAIVQKIVNKNTLRLFYADFGTEGNENVSSCRYLRKKYTELPAQALQAKLWRVAGKGGKAWKDAVMNKFAEICGEVPEGGIVAEVKAGFRVQEIEIHHAEGQELHKTRKLVLSLRDLLEDKGRDDVASKLVEEKLLDWETVEIQTVPEMPNHERVLIISSTEVKAVLDKKFIEEVKRILRDEGESRFDPSPYLLLLRLQEQTLTDFLEEIQFSLKNSNDNGHTLDEKVAGYTKKLELLKESDRIKNAMNEIKAIREERERDELTAFIDNLLDSSSFDSHDIY